MPLFYKLYVVTLSLADTLVGDNSLKVDVMSGGVEGGGMVMMSIHRPVPFLKLEKQI